jgi:protein-disulfide isomerase
MKRFLPILLLLALTISVVACQSDKTDVDTDITANSQVAVAVEASSVEGDSPAVPESSGEIARVADTDDTAHGATAEAEDAADHHEPEGPEGEHPEAGIPGFVPPEPASLEMGSEALAFSLGNPDAAVQIVEFTDYQCPYCQRYAVDTMPAVVENLVETGRVYYAVKDLSLDAIHPEARAASVAARCAGEQGEYLAMHDAIFEAQAEWSGTGAEAEAVFAGLAADLDLDADVFSTCVADGGHGEKVQANVKEALSLGVTGTPVFFIDGYGVTGARPFEMFEMAVELAEIGELDDLVEAHPRQAYETMIAQQAVA